MKLLYTEYVEVDYRPSSRNYHIKKADGTVLSSIEDCKELMESNEFNRRHPVCEYHLSSIKYRIEHYDNDASITAVHQDNHDSLYGSLLYYVVQLHINNCSKISHHRIFGREFRGEHASKVKARAKKWIKSLAEKQYKF